MAGRTEITTNFSAGNKASGADFFTDVTCPVTGTILIQLVIGTEGVVKFSQDGTNFYALNSNVAIAADSWYAFEVAVKQGDTINLNQAIGTVNIKACRLYH